MIPQIDEKQIAVRLQEHLIEDLDDLAKRCSVNRNHLMLSLVITWLSVLGDANYPGIFYIANLLRVREVQMHGSNAYEHEFTESRNPEKPLPIKFSEPEIRKINALASVNHISRHLLLKTMIIVGIEELVNLTARGSYEYGTIEPKLYNSFSRILKKGFSAFKTYIK